MPPVYHRPALKSHPAFAEKCFVKLRSLPRTLILFVSLSACTATEESSIMEPAPVVEVPYTCTNFSKYNTKADCNAATLAQCVSAYQIFPNGGQDCWSPVEGHEICTNPSYTPPVWLYVAGTAWCRTGDSGSPHPLYRLRSSQGCSSSICLCPGSEVLYDVNDSCQDTVDCDAKTNPPSGTINCCPGMTCP
jgi:hypothetical protein